MRANNGHISLHSYRMLHLYFLLSNHMSYHTVNHTPVPRQYNKASMQLGYGRAFREIIVTKNLKKIDIHPEMSRFLESILLID